MTGYGCVEVGPGGAAMIEGGVFRLERGRGASPRSVSDRLAELYADFRALVERLRPHSVAVEVVFAHYRHPATGIVMAHARGVILLATRQAGLSLVELRPNEVKRSLTAYGHAGKDQMQRAVQAVFALAEPPRPPDVADALAIALCAGQRLTSGAGTAPRPRRSGSSRRAPKHLLAHLGLNG